MILLILIIVGIIWAITAIVNSARNNARKRDIERIKADNAKRAEAQKQMQVAMKLVEARRKAIEAEQQKQAKVQEKQAKEQEKQAKMLLKHEEEILKLNQKLEKSERDMEYWKERIANLYALLDTVQMRQSGMVVGSTSHTKCQNEIISLESKIHTAEENYYKAKNTKESVMQKLG